MEKIIFFFTILLFIFSCQNTSNQSLAQKYHTQYEVAQQIVKENQSDFSILIQQFPPEYQDAIKKGMASIEKYNLLEFLENEKINEEGLLQLFLNIDQFVISIEETKNFVATIEQEELYNSFQNQLLTNKKDIEEYIEVMKKSSDFSKKQNARFLKKVMENDIQTFVQTTFISIGELEKSLSEVNNHWEEFIANVKQVKILSESGEK